MPRSLPGFQVPSWIFKRPAGWEANSVSQKSMRHMEVVCARWMPGDVVRVETPSLGDSVGVRGEVGGAAEARGATPPPTVPCVRGERAADQEVT